MSNAIWAYTAVGVVMFFLFAGFAEGENRKMDSLEYLKLALLCVVWPGAIIRAIGYSFGLAARQAEEEDV